MTEDKLSDPLDIASKLSDNINQAAIEANRLKPDLEYVEGEGIIECQECGIEIPRARRIAVGSLMCVDCASYFQKLGKRHNHHREVD